MAHNKEIKVSSIKLQYINYPSLRRIKVRLSNGTNIYIVSCHESFEQYGGTVEELRIALPIAYKYNAWLHGKEEE